MDSKKSTHLLNDIGHIVTSEITPNWTELFIEAEIDAELADLCAWYLDENGEEHYPNITRELVNCFVELRRHSKDNEKGAWTKCFYNLKSNGKYVIDFSYGKPRWS
ncbi:DUF600 family protein [Vibrio sp. D420a]|nr:DUF600 family protein [Vibrio sp. D420a]